MKTFEIILINPVSKRGLPFRISRRDLVALVVLLDDLGANVHSITDITDLVPKGKVYDNNIPTEFLFCC